jgi:hypothetical protein
MSDVSPRSVSDVQIEYRFHPFFLGTLLNVTPPFS